MGAILEPKFRFDIRHENEIELGHLAWLDEEHEYSTGLELQRDFKSGLR